MSTQSSSSGKPNKMTACFRMPSDAVEEWRAAARQVRKDAGIGVGDLTALVLQQAAEDLRAGRLAVRGHYLQRFDTGQDELSSPRPLHAQKGGGVPPPD